MHWKEVARGALHHMGGLAALRLVHRHKFRVLMFHGFQDSCQTNVGTICEHIRRYFEPVPLATMATAIRGEATLPPNALAVTIDDGYKNFLLHGHSVFRRYQIPTTMYAVAGFSDRRLWLWTDQIVFGLEHACKAR